MKVVIQQQGNPGAASFVAGPHQMNARGFAYTDDLQKAQIFDSFETAVEAARVRNAWVGSATAALFSFIPVEASSVRRIV